MGSHLSEILATNKSNEIVVTTRRQRVGRGNVRYIVGNAHDDNFLNRLLEDRWDVIVDFMVYRSDEFSNRVSNLLDSCEQYVFLSSSRVYADSKTPITEDSDRLLDVCQDTAYLSTDEYALAKARQENVLKTSGTGNWTIVRPYITFAENRLQLGVLELESWLYRALLGHTIVFSEDIAQRYTTLTYGYDVARGMASIVGESKAFGRAFHITVSQPIKWKDVLEIYLDVIEQETGKRPRVKMVAEHPYISDMAKAYQVLYDRRYDRKFNNSAIGEFIDTSSFLSTEDGIKKSLKIFIENNKGRDFNLSPQHEAKYDRLTGEKMSLRYFHNMKDKLKYVMGRYFPYSIPLVNRIKTLIS